MGRKTKFNPKWLEFKDSNNDRVGLYITSTEDKYRPKCTWRSCEVDISSRGFLSIKDHAKAKNIKKLQLFAKVEIGYKQLSPSIMAD